MSRRDSSSEKAVRRDSAAAATAPPLESPKRTAEPKQAGALPPAVTAAAAAAGRKESLSRDSGSSESGTASPAARREQTAAAAAAAATTAAARPGLGSPGSTAPTSPVPSASSPLSPTLRSSGTQKLGEAKPSVILISSSSNKDNTTGRRSGAVPVAGSAVSTFGRFEEAKPASAAAPKMTSPGRTVAGAPTGRVIVVDKAASPEEDKWKQLQQQMASASPKVRKAETEEDRRRQLEEIESLGMSNPLAK